MLAYVQAVSASEGGREQGVKYEVYCSYLQIYNEEITDLLAEDTSAKLNIREHHLKGPFVENLSEQLVLNGMLPMLTVYNPRSANPPRT
jgi:Kinesin motor domain